MLKHEHWGEGTELAKLLIQLFEDQKIKESDSNIENILLISSLYKEEDKSSEVGLESLLKAIVGWSIHQGIKNYQGNPHFHLLLAELYCRKGEYGKAQKHFLRSTSPEEFCVMLIKWSVDVNPSERDLLIARSVFHYLCLGNLKDAKIIFKMFLENTKYPNTPLINYLKFLLMTLERDAFPLFQKLREKYKASLEREASFQQYLDEIALKFYNQKTQVGGGGGFGGMLGELMKGFFQNPQQQN